MKKELGFLCLWRSVRLWLSGKPPTMKTHRTLLLTLAFTPIAVAADPKPVFDSKKNVTEQTPGHAVPVDADITGAKKLYLVVTDGGNGFGSDWADWAEPRLVINGKERKLTDLKWKSARVDWGQTRVNKNAGGGDLRIHGKPVEYGIGVHANSVVEYDLPKGTTRFKARAGLDNGGTDQGGATSVRFYVFTEKPNARKLFVGSRGGGRGGNLEPEEALAALEAGEGLEAALFANEPSITNPSNIDIDHRGRVWVAEIVNYRRHKGKRPEGDRIVIVEDTDGDGKEDKQTVFYQEKDFFSPHGICVLGNRVIVSVGDQVFVLTDTNGDDKADEKKVLFTGIAGTQHDHGIHAFVFGPDGKLYFNFGNTGRQIKDAEGKPIIDMAGNEVNNKRQPYQEGMVFRCNMDGSEFETLGWNFRNNWEVTVDSFGTLWQSDNDDDGNRGVRINYVMEFGNFGYKDEFTGAGWRSPRPNIETEVPLMHWHLNDPGVVPNLLQTGAGSPTGITVYEGDLLPEIYRGAPIHCDAGPNVCRAYPVKKSGAGYTAEIAPVLTGVADRWYRPSDVSVAPDGSLMVADWYDPGVGGHGAGDLDKGRVYRVAPPGKAYKVPKFDFETATGAAEALKNPNFAVRYLAWTALHEMGAEAEPALLKLWNGDHPVFRARALWLLGKIEGKSDSYIAKAIADSDPDIRVTGVRLARQESSDLVAVIRKLVGDEAPEVRRECAIALRHLDSAEMPRLWAKLAEQHDGKDRWYLEALGIGADKRWDECLGALKKLEGKGAADVVWRSRGKRSAELIAMVLADPNTGAETKPRFVRALDFQPAEARDAALENILKSANGLDPATVVEVLRRASGFSLENASPAVKEAVARYLASHPGESNYYDIVKRFRITGETDALVTLASAKLDTNAGNALVDFRAFPAVAKAMQAKEPLLTLLESIAATNRNEAIDWLMNYALVGAPSGNLKRAAVKALGRSRNGENKLLAAAKDGQLPDTLRFATGAVLSKSRDRRIRDEAAKVLPMPAVAGNKILPPIHELIRRKGDATKGKVVYQRACLTCHKIGEAGIDFGPALTEIGSKLAKEAMYEAIFDPSAAISFGYEGFEVKKKNGETILGYIASETDDTLSIRAPGGVTLPIRKSDIASRKQLADSLMMPNLQAAMTETELVDLIEYLGTLQKK